MKNLDTLNIPDECHVCVNNGYCQEQGYNTFYTSMHFLNTQGMK